MYAIWKVCSAFGKSYALRHGARRLQSCFNGDLICLPRGPCRIFNIIRVIFGLDSVKMLYFCPSVNDEVSAMLGAWIERIVL